MLKDLPLNRPWPARLIEAMASVFVGVPFGSAKLHTLNASALRDIGIDQSKFESIQAEADGYAHLTRRRVRAGVGEL